MPRRLLINAAACSDALSLTGLLKRSRNRARGRRVLEDFSTPWQLDIRKGKTGVLYAEESGAQKPINWAFLSCGRVAHDYANALRCVDGAKPYVVATRSADDLPRAEAFRDRHGFEKAVGTYAEALLDPNVDVVYLSSLHSARVEHVTAILECGKHCVVEKPLACNGADGKRLVELARSKNLFMMEGMWTRCFPAVEHARRLINDGTIGAVTAVISDFGFDAADSGVYPTDMNDPSTGDPIYFSKLTAVLHSCGRGRIPSRRDCFRLAPPSRAQLRRLASSIRRAWIYRVGSLYRTPRRAASRCPRRRALARRAARPSACTRRSTRNRRRRRPTLGRRVASRCCPRALSDKTTRRAQRQGQGKREGDRI